MGDLTDLTAAQTVKLAGVLSASGDTETAYITSTPVPTVSDHQGVDVVGWVTGNAASATADSGNPVKTGGVVGIDTTLFTAGHRANTQMNAAASTYVDTTGKILSFSAFSSFTTVASATDVFTLTGSATKTVKIRAVMLSGSNTGATNALVIALKRSTANSGGTSSTLTAVPLDSQNAAATATARSYTANPTLGSLVGNINGTLIFLPQLATDKGANPREIVYGQNGEQPVVLRGTSEVFSINLNGVALGGTTVLSLAIAWTEE